MALSYRDNRQEVGWAILLAVGGAFAYFTLWIVLVPLLEEDASRALDDLLFPIDRFYILQVITLAGVAMAGAAVTFLGLISLGYGLGWSGSKGRRPKKA